MEHNPGLPQSAVDEQFNQIVQADHTQNALLEAAYRQGAAYSGAVEDLTVRDFGASAAESFDALGSLSSATPNALPAANENLGNFDLIGGLLNEDQAKAEALFNAANAISLSAEEITLDGLLRTVKNQEEMARKQRLEAVAEQKARDDFFFHVLEPADREARQKAKDTAGTRVAHGTRVTGKAPRNRSDKRKPARTPIKAAA